MHAPQGRSSKGCWGEPVFDRVLRLTFEAARPVPHYSPQEVPHECSEGPIGFSVVVGMPRKLRFVPEESLVEITCRTLPRG